MAMVATAGVGGGKKTTTTTTKKTTSSTVPKTTTSKTTSSSSNKSAGSTKTTTSTPRTTTTTSTPKTTTSSSSNKSTSTSSSNKSSSTNLLTAISNALNNIKNATTSSSSSTKTSSTPANTGSVYSAPATTPKASTPAAVTTGPYVSTPTVQKAVNSAPAASTPTQSQAVTGPYNSSVGSTTTQTAAKTSTTPKVTNPTPEQIPTYDQSSTRDDVIKFIQDNNITGDAQKGVIQASNSYLDQSLAAKQALNDANIEGTVRPSNALNPYTSNALIETKYGNNGDTLVTDYRTGDQGILPSAATIKELTGQNEQPQADTGSSGGGSYYGGGSGGGGGGGSYEPVYEGSNNYYDDLMAAFMEQSAAARDAAIEAILKNLDAVKGSYKSQIEDVIAEYQKLVNQNEVAKDRARRVIRENQANRGQLDSGLGRQEQLDMNIGYDNITSNLNAARVKAVNDINNLIIQAEAEANTNKANVINNYNNALLEYRLANQG